MVAAVSGAVLLGFGVDLQDGYILIVAFLLFMPGTWGLARTLPQGKRSAKLEAALNPLRRPTFWLITAALILMALTYFDSSKHP